MRSECGCLHSLGTLARYYLFATAHHVICDAPDVIPRVYVLLRHLFFSHAVSWFGSENYRKAFHCTPRMSMFQADYRMLRYVVPRIFSYHYRNPLLMRMGSVDEIREALRLQLCGQQSLWDHCLGLTGVGELSAWQSLCICEHLLSKMSVQAMNNCFGFKSFTPSYRSDKHLL